MITTPRFGIINLKKENNQEICKLLKQKKKLMKTLKDEEYIKDICKQYFKQNKYLKYNRNASDLIILTYNKKYEETRKKIDNEPEKLLEYIKDFLLDCELITDEKAFDYINIDVNIKPEDRKIIFIF